MAKQINIREELNKRDTQSCTTDFVNMYESANLSLDKKKELAKLLAENKSNKVISKFFESAEGNQIAQDYIDSKNDNFEKDKEATREVRKELAKQGVATNVDGEPISETFVKGPRGEFKLSDKSAEELKKDGYGFHHEFEKDGKKYQVLTKDNQSLATLKESTSSNSLEQQIRDAIKNVFKGYDEQEYNDVIGDYLVIDIAPQDGRTKVEVRAELGYNSMDKIADALNPIVQRIDKDAYFDHDTSGVISAYVSGNKLTESEAYPDEDDEETAICQWCDGEYPVSELKNEVDLGHLCPTCISAIKSRGEKLKFEENLKEEYGYYKDEPYCEEIADSLENGIWVGETNNGTSWELTINGYNSDEFSPSFADYLAEEVAYPVRDGHLAYLGIEMILYKSSMESIFGYDELDKLIPDLIKLDLDRETIDEWLSSSNPDAILDFHYDFNIAFDEDEWAENNREDVDLPSELTLSIYDFDYVDGETNIDELNDSIGDYLSDEYGYCHNGFQFDVEGDKIYVYDIDWDLSENLKMLGKSLKESKSIKNYSWSVNGNGELEIYVVDEYGNESLLAAVSDCAGMSDTELDNLAQEVIEENGYIVENFKKSESLKESHTNTNKQPLKPATFVIEDGQPFEGYDEEYYWNGWECPWFTKEVGDTIIDYYKDYMHFNAEKDAFAYVSPNDDGEIEYFVGQDIETVDGVKHLYPIGNKSWIWDKYTENEDLEEELSEDDNFTYKGLSFTLWYLDGNDEFAIVCDDIEEDYDNTPAAIGFISMDAPESAVMETIKKNYNEFIYTVGKGRHYAEHYTDGLNESVGKLLSNEEFVKAYKEEGFEGAEIILDWDKKQHTFEEWEELLLNTYLDLEQDLLAQGDFETVKHNRDTYINRIIGDKVLSESKPVGEDSLITESTQGNLERLINKAINLYFFKLNPFAFTSNPYNTDSELIDAFRTDLHYITYVDEYLYEWENELDAEVYSERELELIRNFVNLLNQIKEEIAKEELPPKPNYLGDE